MEGNLARKQEQELGAQPEHEIGPDDSYASYEVTQESPALTQKKIVVGKKQAYELAEVRAKLKQVEQDRTRAELAEMAKEIQASLPPKPMTGYEQYKEIEAAKLAHLSDAIEHDAKYYDTVGKRLAPHELNSYRTLDQELMLVDSQIGKAGFFEKRALNKRKAALEKELEPYWDKIQEQDLYPVLKEGKKSWGNPYFDKIAAQMKDVPGFDMYAFAELSDRQEELDKELETAGFFKKISLRSELNKVMKALEPFQDAIQRGGGSLSEKSDLKLSGKSRL